MDQTITVVCPLMHFKGKAVKNLELLLFTILLTHSLVLTFFFFLSVSSHLSLSILQQQISRYEKTERLTDKQEDRETGSGLDCFVSQFWFLNIRQFF